MLPLVTERLLIRRFVEKDWSDLLEYAGDPRTVAYLDYDTANADMVKEFIAEHSGREIGVEGDYCALAIQHKADGKVIGDVGIRVRSKADRQGEIGWNLNAAYQSQGYATEAARLLLAFGFATLDLYRIMAACDDRNQASLRLMERLGMRREAHLIHNGWYKDGWRSEVIYAILRHEWEQQR